MDLDAAGSHAELYDFGLDPTSAPAGETISLVAANCRWEHAGQRFFDGEVEACINGRTVILGAYFGVDVHGIVTLLARRAVPGWRMELPNRVRLRALVARLDDQRVGGPAGV